MEIQDNNQKLSNAQRERERERGALLTRVNEEVVESGGGSGPVAGVRDGGLVAVEVTRVEE